MVDEVRSAMSNRPRALPHGMAFDAVGHALYARVTALPRYVQARAEAELIRVHRREILALAGSPPEAIDLLSGDGVQARPLLDEVQRYVAVEPCRAVLEDTLDGLAAAFPRLDLRGIVGEPAFGLRMATRDLGHRLVLLLGSTLGRFDPTAARLELARLRSLMEPEDRLLIGVDLAKACGRFAEAYDDSTDVYAAFARNALRRTNREVGTNFKSADWTLEIEEQGDFGRVEVRFVARRILDVSGGRACEGWDFLPGEALIVEHAYKPTEGQIAAIALGAGFHVVQAWKDGDQGYGLFMLAP